MAEIIRWGNELIELVLATSSTAPVRLLDVAAVGEGQRARTDDRAQPLVELLIVGDGHMLSNTRFTSSGVGSRLRYADHRATVADGWHELRIRQLDADTGLATESVFRAAAGVQAVQTWTEVHNTGGTPRVLQMVSSFATGTVLGADESVADVGLLRARSEWCGEGRWTTIALRGPDGLPEINTELYPHDARGTLATVSRSTWSSGEYLPTGVLANARTGRSLAWQIEHNGAWHWEIDSRWSGLDALALVVTGPNDDDHQWSTRLAPGATFNTVPVSVSVSHLGYEGALAAMTAQRRAVRRPPGADAGTPVIFNDYMNTLMGDPTTERLLPLIDAAAAVGAEYFCVDAGWYDEGGHWWDSVGEWRPSDGRFPDGGLLRVLDHIRARGLRPGLWLEPEVIGVRSPIAETLPPEAFLQRYGQRVVEHSRYHLDLRHPAARQHLDSVVDRLVGDLGVRFFKLDYNVTPGPGTDLDAPSVGAGLLAHNRAHLAWLDAVLDRHPDVIFENCASGAMRMDYAMLARLHLQSTSDQQDPNAYAAIAAAAPAALLPEQAGNWAYPQPGMTAEQIAFTMINGLVGRPYLSGHLDRMSEAELALVRDGVAAYAAIRDDIRLSVGFWPLGLPGWFDQTLALGLRGPTAHYLAVWHRGPAIPGVELAIPTLPGHGNVDVEVVYPRTLDEWSTAWNAATRTLTITPGVAGAGARLFRLSERRQP